MAQVYDSGGVRVSSYLLQEDIPGSQVVVVQLQGVKIQQAFQDTLHQVFRLGIGEGLLRFHQF